MREGIQDSLGLGIWEICFEALRLLKGSLQSLWSGGKQRVLLVEGTGPGNYSAEKIPPPQNQIFF